jgi:hypothetical protein
MDTNFFGYLINGAQAITDFLFGSLPVWQTIGLAAMVTDWMNSVPVLLYVYVNQFINLDLVMTLFTVILILEIIRAIIAIWMWIKNAIPVAG